MLAAAFVAFANHVLDPAPWAREKLSAHAGKTALFDVFPARLAIAVAADGRLQPAPPEALPAVTIRLTHLTLLEVLADGEEAWRKAEISGDTDFAAVIFPSRIQPALGCGGGPEPGRRRYRRASHGAGRTGSRRVAEAGRQKHGRKRR